MDGGGCSIISPITTKREGGTGYRAKANETKKLCTPTCEHLLSWISHIRPAKL